MIVPNKHPSQARNLKLHMSLCINQHRGRVTTTSTIQISNPTTEAIPQNVPSQSRAGKNNLRPIHNPIYSEVYGKLCVQGFIFSPLSVQSPLSTFHLFISFPPTFFPALGAISYKHLKSTKATVHYQTKYNKTFLLENSR